MKTGLIIALLLILQLVYSLPPNVQKGACPKLQTQNIETARFLGRWFEIGTSGWSRRTFQRNCVCTRATYTLKDAIKRLVKVDNTCNDRTPNGRFQRQVGEAVQKDPNDPGKLTVSFGYGATSPYWVMETDHTSYAIIYSCNEIFGWKFESSWIISRTPTMDDAKYKQLEAKSHQLTGFKEQFTKTLQAGCTYP